MQGVGDNTCASVSDDEVMRFYRRIKRELTQCWKFRAYMNEDRRAYLERNLHIWNNLTQEEVQEYIRKYMENMRLKDKKRKREEHEDQDEQIRKTYRSECSRCALKIA
jgi:hypothetical protein